MNEGERKGNSILPLIIILVLFVAGATAFLYLKNYSNQKIREELDETAGNSNTTIVGNFDEKEQPTETANNNSNTAPPPLQNSNSTISEANKASSTNNAEYYYNLGITNMTAKGYSEAVVNFGKAIELNTKVPEYYSKKAEAEVALNKKNDAIKTVEAGLENNPGNTNLINKLEILQSIVK